MASAAPTPAPNKVISALESLSRALLRIFKETTCLSASRRGRESVRHHCKGLHQRIHAGQPDALDGFDAFHVLLG